jgi:hypothetical protein
VRKVTEVNTCTIVINDSILSYIAIVNHEGYVMKEPQTTSDQEIETASLSAAQRIEILANLILEIIDEETRLDGHAEQSC